MDLAQRTNLTAEQLASLPNRGQRFELVEGELRMMSPAGGRHGRVASRLLTLLANHVDQHGLGVTYAAETGFLLSRDPDTVRAPDAAFIELNRLEQIRDDIGYVPIAPDLAGEVVSPHDSFSDVQEKAFAWLNAGTRMVLLVDPGARMLHVYRTADNVAVLDETQELDADDVVPGWKLAVGRLFS